MAIAEVSYDIPSSLPDATHLLIASKKLASIDDKAARDEAIQTVFKLIHNVLGDLENAKKRTVKKTNETFHRKAGRHEAAVTFLRAAGFLEADDPDAAEGGKGALLSMPVAYIARLTDAHHTLAKEAADAGLEVPTLPGSAFNPYASGITKVDTTRSAKAPESWKTEADRVREDVKKRQRELQEVVECAPAVELRPAAFWLNAGRRLEEVIQETAAEDVEAPDGNLLKEQVMSMKGAFSGGSSFKSADKQLLSELSRKRVYAKCLLRVVCPDKSVLQVQFRSAEKCDKVLEALAPLFAPSVREARWYIYQSPPMKRLSARETLAQAGLSPGASLYLGFDGEKPGPPYLEASLVDQLGPSRPDAAVVSPAGFTGEAMGWGAGRKLGAAAAAGSSEGGEGEAAPAAPAAFPGGGHRLGGGAADAASPP